MCRKNPISKISFPTSLAILDYTLYNPKIAKGFQLRFQVCVCAYTWVRQSQFIHSINCGMTAISLREAVFRPLEERYSKLLETLCTTLIRLYITTKTSQKPYENSLVCVPVSVHNAWGGTHPSRLCTSATLLLGIYIKFYITTNVCMEKETLHDNN